MSEQGLSLIDIAPATERVPIGKSFLVVYGISAKGIVAILQRFPQVMQWFRAGVKVNLPELIGEVPDAVAAIIAAGCGTPNNDAAEDTAGRLPVETQLDVLEAIGRLTFKNGFGPFVQRLTALANVAKSVNYGRVQDTKSQAPSNPVSRPATPPKPSGI